MWKRYRILLIVILLSVLILGSIAFVCVNHFIGFARAVGDSAFAYDVREIWVEHDGIRLYGKALIPQGEAPFPTVIYAHGAESDYKADMATLKSLAMSGAACYTFDFYGWTDRSTGPEGTSLFKDSKQRDYEAQVLKQTEDLNAVIDSIRALEFTDSERLYLLGSSMGGATVATAAVSHSEDIRGIILQYPAINLNPMAMVEGSERNVNGCTGPVLILQGTEDKIVPLSMSEQLEEYYNTLYENHANMIVYEGQPHVFTGKIKVEAAREIFQFLKETDGMR